MFTSSQWRSSTKKTVPKNFAIFTGKHLCWSLFFNEVADLQGCNFSNNGLQHSCFSVNIAKFLRAPILKTIWELLLLHFGQKNQSIIR